MHETHKVHKSRYEKVATSSLISTVEAPANSNTDQMHEAISSSRDPLSTSSRTSVVLYNFEGSKLSRADSSLAHAEDMSHGFR